MFRIDYHVHTNFSSDSDADMEDMLKSAVLKGINEIAVTDHVDLDYPPVNYYIRENIEFYEYDIVRSRLREKYKDKIDLVYGLEMGLQPRAKQKIDDFFKDKEFDFVVGSTHAVKYKDLCDGTFFEGKEQKEAFREYFEEVLSSVQCFDNYDVYGHLDVVCRYGDYAEKNLDYHDFPEIIDEILAALIKKNKGIEVNSSGYRYGINATHPSFEIVKRYRELGGEIITTGSDAHIPSDIAADFDDVYLSLKAAGFKAVTTFRKHKPIFIDI